jgi:hypothetical protein
MKMHGITIDKLLQASLNDAFEFERLAGLAMRQGQTDLYTHYKSLSLDAWLVYRTRMDELGGTVDVWLGNPAVINRDNETVN